MLASQSGSTRNKIARSHTSKIVVSLEATFLVVGTCFGTDVCTFLLGRVASASIRAPLSVDSEKESSEGKKGGFNVEQHFDVRGGCLVGVLNGLLGKGREFNGDLL